MRCIHRIVPNFQETLVDNQGNKGVENQGTITASIKGYTSLGIKVVGVRGVDNLRSIKVTNFVNLSIQEIEFLPHNSRLLIFLHHLHKLHLEAHA